MTPEQKKAWKENAPKFIGKQVKIWTNIKDSHYCTAKVTGYEHPYFRLRRVILYNNTRQESTSINLEKITRIKEEAE